mgnify:CR=1 FL=1
MLLASKGACRHVGRRRLLSATSGSLRNDFFLLRHGWSLANEAGVIISQIDDGRRAEYGLHPKGMAQAELVAPQLREIARGREIVIFSSDFSRTMETAGIVAEGLGIDEVHETPELRERARRRPWTEVVPGGRDADWGLPS